MNNKMVLLKSTANTLTPIVKLLLECGVSQDEFNELSKQVFVNAAEQEYQDPDKRRITADRIATITGMHRKDVGRIRKHLDGVESNPRIERNRKQRIVDGWLADNDFCHSPGNSKALDKSGEDSFETLVRRYGGDISAANVLVELKRSGLVEETDEKLHLLKTSFVPDNLGAERIEHGFRQATRMLDTLHYNLTTRHKSQMFQSAVDNQYIPRYAVKAINRFLKTEGIAFLHKLDAKMREVEDETLDDDELCEISLGLYCNEDPPYRGQR